ncbi:MAG: hypothetical protein ABSA85_00095 [Terracidiphilus sp.]
MASTIFNPILQALKMTTADLIFRNGRAGCGLTEAMRRYKKQG